MPIAWIFVALGGLAKLLYHAVVERKNVPLVIFAASSTIVAYLIRPEPQVNRTASSFLSKSLADTWSSPTPSSFSTPWTSSSASRSPSYDYSSTWRSSPSPSRASTPRSRYITGPSIIPSATPDTSMVTSSDGKMYSVPKTYVAELTRKRTAVDAKEAAFKRLEREGKKLKDEIEAEELILNRSNEAALTKYNAKVKRFNTLYKQYEKDLEELNASIKAYNTWLQAVGTVSR